MTTVQALGEFLDQICPPELAESWDNTGLLVGDRTRRVESVACCLTITPGVVAEAVQRRAGLIVSHHPFPFFAEKHWTSDTATGQLLLALAENKIAVYSPHTAHDSAFYGVNRQLAAFLELKNVEPLEQAPLLATKAMLAGLNPETCETLAGEIGQPLGGGRVGQLETPALFGELVERTRRFFRLNAIGAVGDKARPIQTVAIGCGAADTFIPQALGCGAEALFVGETKYHKALEASEAQLALIVPGHFASERFAMETLAGRIGRVFGDLTVFAAENESDPLAFV